MGDKWRIQLGDNVRDTISGFEGVATARVEYLYGCRRVTVTPRTIDKDGKPVEPQYFDEAQLEVIKKPKQEAKTEHKSGPRDDRALNRKEASRGL